MAKNDFQYGGWNSYTLQCGMWLWDHDSEFTKWSNKSLSCNVTRGSGMTCHWIRQLAAPCNVTRSSGIMTLNSPGGSILQCGRWLWDNMQLNSPKRPPYWNSISGFNFGHTTAVDMSFCTTLQNFIQIGPPWAEKSDVMSILKMADLRHLGF